ncbi:MAG: hypothetical protein FOGNACKC_04238 [Anaerolineae bacterium]|nr:hypothetical protein [Anaerolineae bacterium]
MGRKPQILIEQMALLLASFIWTAIVLVAIIFFWAYQDVQARWEYVVNAPPQALAQAGSTPTPSPTLWAGPGPTLTPTPTSPPTAVPTRVVPMPELLPETLNPGETPVLVPVQSPEQSQDQSQPANVNFLPTATPAPAPPAPEPIQDVPAAGDVPTHLSIPSVGIDAEVIPVGWSIIQKDGFEYSIWQVADYAVGWHKTSAPLGQPGNTVMAGHHNVNGEVFRDLVNVEIGDKVTIYAGEKKYDYVVDFKTIVKEKGEPVEVRKRNAEWISPTNDERITFVTCWPYTNNTHRVIVVARRA